MTKSEAINELATALAKAQGQMAPAKKDSDNPFFKSKYADLAAVVDAIRGPFAEHGLSWVQISHPTTDQTVCIETLLLHASGQWISGGPFSIPVTKADAQGVKSAVTYARRGSLELMAGVPAEDDDGNAATKSKGARAPGLAEPTQEDDQRGALITAIQARADVLKLSKKDRVDYATKYLGGASPATADLAALQDLLGALSHAR